ncbi:A-kinase anchor protein 17A-like [Tubulanus polymorphus]|uniref:A-kinase anchor protein 17A-like n=1 Tax=Tubulanus polymorphus TaxID=672921 RepID=UPI003DA3F54E
MASACNDTSDAVEFFEPQNLYLKPIAKLNVCVQLPLLKLAGKSISNWEVMEKVKTMIKPDSFISLKIIKSTLEFLRFEGEIENKSLIKNCIAKLDAKTIKLSGFPDVLKVRAAEAKVIFPTRHDWDSYFRDAKHMNEMRAGERPDTIFLKDVPCRWFANRREKDKERVDKPSEFILRKVFEQFGEIRCADIPMLDPYREEVYPGVIQTFSFGQHLTFSAYVQFKEYISFVKAMDTLRGMKMMHIGEDGKASSASVKVDFDRTRHLTDKAIARRRKEREKLMELERLREEKVRLEREDEKKKQELERIRQEEEDRERERKREEKLRKREKRMKEREEKRKIRKQEEKNREDERKMALKIAMEERKLLIAKRQLESIHLLTELLNRVKVVKVQEDLVRKEKEIEEIRRKQVEEERLKKLADEKRKLDTQKRKKEKLEKQEKELRDKILLRMKAIEEKKAETQREELRKKIRGKTKLKSAVILNR